MTGWAGDMAESYTAGVRHGQAGYPPCPDRYPFPACYSEGHEHGRTTRARRMRRRRHRQRRHAC